MPFIEMDGTGFLNICENVEKMGELKATLISDHGSGFEGAIWQD